MSRKRSTSGYCVPLQGLKIKRKTKHQGLVGLLLVGLLLVGLL